MLDNIKKLEADLEGMDISNIEDLIVSGQSKSFKDDLITNVEPKTNKVDLIENLTPPTIESANVKQKKSSNKLMWIVLFVVFMLVSSLAGVYAYFYYSTNLQKSSGFFEGINKGIKIGIDQGVSVLDFENFDGKDLKTLVDLDSLVSSFEKNPLNSLINYAYSNEFAGKTIEEVFDIVVDVKDSAYGSFRFETKLDSFVTYSKDYNIEKLVDNKFDTYKFIKTIKAMSDEEIYNLIPDFETRIKFLVNSDIIDVSGDVNLVVLDKNLYFTLENLEGTGGYMPDEVKLFEGKTIYLNLEKFFDYFIDSIREADTNDLNNVDYNKILEQDLDITEGELIILKEVGPKIEDIVRKELVNLTLFSNPKKVEPIRRESKSLCEQADINFNSILNTGKVMTQEMGKLIKEYYGEGVYSDVFFDDLIKIVNDSSLEAYVSICQLNGALSGFGFGGYFVDKAVGTVDFQMDYLVSNFDSTYKIEPREYDLDYTEYLNSTIESAGKEKTYDSTPYFETEEYKADSPYSNIDYDKYMELLDGISKRYSSGEITYDEYEAELDKLDSEYFPNGY